MTEFAMIIGGTRVRAASEFDVMNPSTGKLIAKAPNASAQDLGTVGHGRRYFGF